MSESLLQTFSPLQKMTGSELTIEVIEQLDPSARRASTVQFLIPETSSDPRSLSTYSVEYLIRKSLSKTEHARCVGFLKQAPLEPSFYF
jgi:hypothetical protein